MTSTRSRHVAVENANSGTPWLPGLFVVLLLVLPTVVVLPGPLVSNGSPAKMLAYAMAALVFLTFFRGRVVMTSAGYLHTGIAFLAVYAFCKIVTLARTYQDPLGPVAQATVTRTVLTTVAGVGVAAYLMTRMNDTRARNFVLGMLLVGATYAAIIGILQGISDADYKYLLQPPGFVLKVEKGLATRDGFTRVVGTSDHPIEFSVIVAATIPIAAHFLRLGSTRNVRIYSGIAFAALLLAVPASVSRTAIVAVIASAVVYIFALTVREILTLITLLGTIVLVYYLIAPELFGAIVKLFVGASEDDSITSRTDDYAYVSVLFRQNPVLGSGFASIDPTQTRYLDNTWLGTLISGGLVGVAGLAVLVVGGVIAATMALRNVRTTAERDLVFALSGSYAALVVSTTVFDMFAFQQAMFMLFVVFGVLWSLAYRGRSAGDGERSHRELRRARRNVESAP
ncbi:O-antigen ligase family protein [Rhodococcus sp. BP-349]|uniref:O-antigen ligase family protein n=1 Tax=unclassified Rhodococcus (in: high G+C Gram-positive bacteria) TaxID=192944 RepID=UPI001C9A30C7|nr:MULTISPECIES: O-antigen ligase family protein [unclassified Rhodococcus (in: high G+C Gram-positive bacteria)]MBY6539470.1 O-antigen ligase family protein [Rhodococcus sp. BP-363]MBY6544202.1 O-antigen ligase family protein [Rhodococcus sp. BP-369]MBY6563432.1 O-antigen ligase family protein [Rhodococcus sp. BP-370]MBY6577724.1 O-antigen ligase family protein [Rhodococcus sp. BP-364]MBY6587025.1 O-antigen ligase family protein [Rhodococcus sp. BP-358]